MSEYVDKINLGKFQNAFIKLNDDLVEFNTKSSPTLAVDNEMLTLVVGEALNGVDISARYPAFYRKILNDSELRQAFLDAIGSIENDKHVDPVAASLPLKPALAFLGRQPQTPTIIHLGVDKWRTVLRQSVEQLQSLFSPPELAYRSDPSLYDDPWITLLRGDIEIAGSQYAVILECSPAEETEDALAVSLNLAVTLQAQGNTSGMPLEATLQWGDYGYTVAVSAEGRTRFANVPLPAILDETQEKINTELFLTIEKTS
jgi:hypothetical protein